MGSKHRLSNSRDRSGQKRAGTHAPGESPWRYTLPGSRSWRPLRSEAAMGQNIGIEADNKKPSHLDGLVQVAVSVQVSVTDAISVAQN